MSDCPSRSRCPSRLAQVGDGEEVGGLNNRVSQDPGITAESWEAMKRPEPVGESEMAAFH